MASRARPTDDEHSSFRAVRVNECRVSWTASSAMYPLLTATPQLLILHTPNMSRSVPADLQDMRMDSGYMAFAAGAR